MAESKSPLAYPDDLSSIPGIHMVEGENCPPHVFHHTHRYTYADVRTCKYAFMHMYECMRTHVHTHAHAYTHACIHTFMHTYTMHKHKHLHMCTQTCIHIQVIIHTYTAQSHKVSLKSVVLGQSSLRHNHSQVGQTGKYCADPFYPAPFTPPCPLSSYPS